MRLSLTVLLTFWLGYALGQSPIVTAEYFIDSDPGIGNGTSVSLSPGTSISINFDVELDGLEPGIHYLHTRVKNDENKWSLYSRKPFHVTNFIPAQTIVAVEYFIDDDPGIGNGTNIPIAAGSEISETFAIPIDDMEPGIHHLQIRIKNSLDKWSLYGRKLFYVMPEQVSYNIVAAEYFIDTDPGLGNGIPLTITPGLSISEAFEIATPDTLMTGAHMLHIRVMDEAERWSLYASSLFTVDETVGLRTLNDEFNIYPNPTLAILNLETGNSNLDFVRIIDMTGKVVMTPSPQHQQIDIQHLVPGTYLVQVGADGHLFSERLVKQ